ncbi:DUF732 domain-containing protein [Nocardia higoensis]|uniref:DUF732 domain-containing protein n=1 Tax=Nocardia higoensis TaxID=228599 RepID=A0ABS0D9I5_9NOCA|nr:DUF732 domain-containing protein [Nocardia higoensis]MBF6355134.1 DUF732 domain-containing protein [Nocardia higoensis]
MRTHPLRSRSLPTLVTFSALSLGLSALLSGSGTPAVATPDMPSAATHSGAHTLVDRQFLRESFFDDESAAVQNAAIKLARSQCAYLDTAGNRPADHIYLAESATGTVEYPHLFLEAAIHAYCPHNRLL